MKNTEKNTEKKTVSLKTVSEKNDDYCTVLVKLFKDVKAVRITTAVDTVRIYSETEKICDCYNRRRGLAIHFNSLENTDLQALEKLGIVTDVRILAKYQSAYMLGNKLTDFVAYVEKMTKKTDEKTAEKASKKRNKKTDEK